MKFLTIILCALVSQSAFAAIALDESNVDIVHVTDQEAHTLVENLGLKAKSLRCEQILFGGGGYFCISQNVQVTGAEGKAVFKVYSQAASLHWKAARLGEGDMIQADMICSDEATCQLEFHGMGGALSLGL